MRCNHTVSLLALLFVLLVNLAGCARMISDPAAHNAASPSATPITLPSRVPKQITPADLTKLRWIEGSWRGTGGDVPPFYERYKFENESTLVVETLSDETLKKVSDVSRFELKDGHFGSGTPDNGSVATALDERSIDFGPIGKSRNYFRWQRESDKFWEAILQWTDKNGGQKARVYLMERWPAKKQ